MNSENEMLGRWRTVGETNPRADRTLIVERVVEYQVRETGGYKPPSTRSFDDADAALRAAARIRDDVDGRGRYQQWEPIDRSGRPIQPADQD